MLKKQGEKANLKSVCPVHGNQLAMPVSSDADSGNERPTDQLPGPLPEPLPAESRKKLNPGIFHDRLLGVAVLFAICGVLLNQWLTTGREDDKHAGWDARVEKLSDGDAKLMEVRLIADELKSRHLGPWTDRVGQTELVATVKLAKFYADRKRVPEAITAFERALKPSGSRSALSLETWAVPWETWAVLCRIYNQQHQYGKSVQLIEKVKCMYPSQMNMIDLSGSGFHELAIEAYDGVGQKQKADNLRKLVRMREDKASEEVLINRSLEVNYKDMRLAAFDYAVALLHEGKAAEAVVVLQRLLQDENAARQRIDSPQFRSKVIMMLPVAYTGARKWEAAEVGFPRALRLAAQQKSALPRNDTKPPLYVAYAAFLAHQGKSAEAARYLQMATEARNARSNMDSPDVFAESDLYGPEPKLDRKSSRRSDE